MPFGDVFAMISWCDLIRASPMLLEERGVVSSDMYILRISAACLLIDNSASKGLSIQELPSQDCGGNGWIVRREVRRVMEAATVGRSSRSSM
jgi:hypothetical protein